MDFLALFTEERISLDFFPFLAVLEDGFLRFFLRPLTSTDLERDAFCAVCFVVCWVGSVGFRGALNGTHFLVLQTPVSQYVEGFAIIRWKSRVTVSNQASF